MVTRADILQYVKDNYQTEPEHLWVRYPGYEVLRHTQNGKWYAIIMDVPRNKVGLDGDDRIDILDVKCDPNMVRILSSQTGFCRAYHMNKEHWLTVFLNGTVRDDEIFCLIDTSFENTKLK